MTKPEECQVFTFNNDLYRSVPLADPGKQIRLLKYKQRNALGWLYFELVAWNLDEAPAYNAISYTWGEDVSTTVLVNGVLVQVRQKCYDALNQALQTDSNAYIWIDCICINQYDKNEKGQQVQRMFDVYQDAKSVLVCLGAHADNSELLAKVCSSFTSVELRRWLKDFGVRTLDLDEIAQSLKASGIDPADAKTFSHTSKGILCVRKTELLEPYVDIARDLRRFRLGKATVLQRHGSLHINVLALGILRRVQVRLPRMSPHSRGPVQKYLHGRGIAFYEFLEYTEHLRCSDARDMIYGATRLIDWRKSNSEPVLPDYTRGTWDLAVLVAATVDLNNIPDLMRMLRIDVVHPDVHSRRKARTGCSPHIVDHSIRYENEFRVVMIRLSAIQGSSFFIATEGGSGISEPSDPALEQIVKLLDTQSIALGSRPQPQQVLADAKVAAMVSSETRLDDLLAVWPGNRKIRHVGLALRQTPESSLDVVGTCMVREGLLDWMSGDWKRKRPPTPGMSTSQVPGDGMFEATLKLQASIEDLMLLFHIDSAGEPERRSPTNNLLRLMMRPLGQPKGAARLEAW